jgi:GTP-binding protein
MLPAAAAGLPATEFVERLGSRTSPMTLPVIALVGRPNVGKSTLFNRLTRTRDALVADFPGLTRDRQYGLGKVGSGPYLVVDTGGLAAAGQQIDGLRSGKPSMKPMR